MRSSKPRERGAIRKRWSGRTSVALIFPNTYAVGMTNLGLQVVYSLLNSYEEVVAERFFVPEGSQGEVSRMGDPWISVESGRPLSDFDLLLFSVSFEADYLGLVRGLASAGIGLRAAQRSRTEPMVLAGGVATLINPEPIALFLDAFLLGEAEAMLEALVKELPCLTDARQPRRQRLAHLANTIPGTYVPEAYLPLWSETGELSRWEVEKGFPWPVTPARLTRPPMIAPHTQILSPQAAFPDMFLVELARGCGRGCRFCAAGFVYRPPRPWPFQALREALTHRKEALRVGLVGLEFVGREDIEELCQELLSQGLELAFSSLRADTLTRDFVTLMRASRARTATIAPEAGSQRLRQVINKNLDETAVLRAAEMLVAGGIPNLKLYFMLGLPTETEEDVEGIVRLVDEIRSAVRPLGRARGRLGSITASVSTFVPKAWTPFQWAAIAEGAELKRRRRYLEQALGRLPNVRLRLDARRHATAQAILSRGDRRLAPVLEDVALRQVSWRRALSDVGLSDDMFLKGRRPNAAFPWEAVGHPVRRTYLWAEWQRAREARSTGACQPVKCRRCGACTKA